MAEKQVSKPHKPSPEDMAVDLTHCYGSICDCERCIAIRRALYAEPFVDRCRVLDGVLEQISDKCGSSSNPPEILLGEIHCLTTLSAPNEEDRCRELEAACKEAETIIACVAKYGGIDGRYSDADWPKCIAVLDTLRKALAAPPAAGEEKEPN